MCWDFSYILTLPLNDYPAAGYNISSKMGVYNKMASVLRKMLYSSVHLWNYSYCDFCMCSMLPYHQFFANYMNWLIGSTFLSASYCKNVFRLGTTPPCLQLSAFQNRNSFMLTKAAVYTNSAQARAPTISLYCNCRAHWKCWFALQNTKPSCSHCDWI